MAEITLDIGGTAFGGWKSVQASTSLEDMSGQYTLGLSERWPEQSSPLVIPEGAFARLRIDGEAIITGYVDSIDHGHDGHAHDLSVTGRDSTADLVDCSAVHAKGEWRNARLDVIARDLVKPFNIRVIVEGDIGAPFPVWTIEPGETVFSTLERASRQRGVLLTSDGQGALVIGKPGTTKVPTALRTGDNVLSMRSRNDQGDRFSEYIVKGQMAGTDDAYGEAAAAVRARAADAGITRHRPLIVIDEDQGDIAGFQRRAKWEATVRAARGLTIECTVQGWKHAGGVWRKNTLAQVYDEVLRIDRELLIRDVEYLLDEGGQRCQMVLTPREAYSMIEMPAKRKAPARRGRKSDDAEDVFR
ncbi:phage baseplate assembly protein [Pseudoxanthomonas sp. 22568]|uniref:phage baseplate assembly protein n=1 Tax=Pseudoxanthomonas sp. 22568 TaxID=3453945 RepID=UPI003F865A28